MVRNGPSESEDERSRLADLEQQSELPLAINVSADNEVTAFTGWFRTDEDQDRSTAAAQFLGAARTALAAPEDVELADQPRGVDAPSGSANAIFDAVVDGVPYYGCGALVATDEAGTVRAVSCRWPSKRLRLEESDYSPERAKELVRRRALAPESGEPIPDPTLAIWDPEAVLGLPGEPQPVFVFDFGDAEQPADVLVDVAGTGVVDVVSLDPGGDPASVHATPLYHLNPATGVPDFVSFEPSGLLLPEAASGSATTVARAFFVRFPRMFGTADPDRQLVLKDVVTDPDVGTTHVVFEQQVGPYPVFGCGLRVHLSPSLAIRSISGNHMRVPDVQLAPNVDEDAARYAVLARDQPRSRPEQSLDQGPMIYGAEVDWGDGRRRPERVENGAPPTLERHGLVILPLKLARDGGGQNHLAWWFTTARAETFVSAEDGTIVYEIPRRQGARFVYDAQDVREEYLRDAVLELVDGVEQVDPLTLDTESRPADAAIAATEAFWRLFGRSGFDGRGGHSIAYVEVNLDDPDTEELIEDNAVWAGKYAMFARNFAVSDIVGHELTHGLIQQTAGLVYRAESGAINESYADVFGELIAPDPNPASWKHGTGAGPGGAAFRDLKNPPVGNYAQYLMTTTDNGGVHFNSGIGNKAAVLLCDGDGTSAHPGIGRQRLARLYWDVLTNRLHAWSSYIDVLSNTWQVAREAVALKRRGVTFPGTSAPAPEFDATTPAEVLWAFRQVGLDLSLSSGWFQVPGQATTDFTFFQGETTPPEEQVSDAEVRLVRRQSGSKLLFQGVARVSTGGTVSDPAGTLTATITSSGVGTRSKEVQARVTTPNFELVEVSANLTTVRVAGPTAPVPTDPYPTGWVAHWFDNPLFLGRRYGDIIYQNTALASGTVSDIVLELMDKNGAVMARHRFGDPAAAWNGTGASIFSRTLGGTALEVRVRAWHDFGRAVRYRLVYFITGVNVALPPFTLSEVGYEGVDPMVVIGGF